MRLFNSRSVERHIPHASSLRASGGTWSARTACHSTTVPNFRVNQGHPVFHPRNTHPHSNIKAARAQAVGFANSVNAFAADRKGLGWSAKDPRCCREEESDTCCGVSLSQYPEAEGSAWLGEQHSDLFLTITGMPYRADVAHIRALQALCFCADSTSLTGNHPL